MSMPWRIAALVLGAIAFVSTLLMPGSVLPLPLTLPPVLEAAVAAVSIVVIVWLYEGIFIGVRWVWRRFTN